MEKNTKQVWNKGKKEQWSKFNERVCQIYKKGNINNYNDLAKTIKETLLKCIGKKEIEINAKRKYKKEYKKAIAEKN